MGSIPLPALSVQPPQQQNPIQGYRDFLAMKAAQNQQALAQAEITGEQQKNQMQALQLKDQQNLRTAASGIDWSQPDAFDKFLSAAQKAEVSPQTLSAMALQRQQYLEQLNKTDVSGLEAMKERGNQLAGHIDAVLSASPDQKPQVAQQQAQQALDAGLVRDPGTLSFMRSVAAGQIMPTDDQLTHLKNGVLDSSTQADLALKKQQGQASQAEQQKAQADTEKTQLETQLMRQWGTPEQQQAKYVAIQQRKNLGGPVTPDENAFLQAYQKLKTLVPVANFNLQNAGIAGQGGQPSAIAQALADGTMKWTDVVSPRTPQSVTEALLSEVKRLKPSFNSGDFAIEQSVKKEFTSGDAAKNLTAFNTAIEHAKQLQSAADALQNGDAVTLNRLGNALGYPFGSDQTTNFNVIKNALTGEISKVFKGGQATDAEISAIQGPFNAANSPAQLKGAIQNAVALMNSKRDALKQQYESGSQGKPNFGNTTNNQNQNNFFSGFGGTQRPQ